MEVLSEYFDSVEVEISYKDALQTIYEENRSLKTSLKEQEELLLSLKEQVSQQRSNEEIETLIKNVTQYWQNAEYVQALILLKNSSIISEDVEILYQQYSNEYSNNLLIQVESLIDEGNNNQAIELLKEGADLVSDNSIINDKLNSIRNIKSELLSTLTPVSGEIEYVWDSSKRDNYGNTYSSGICLHQNYDKPAHVVYSLDGKYTTISGKFVLEEKSKNTDGNYVLYVYSLEGGNMTLIYESQVLATATRPIDIEINVTDVMDIVIEVYDSDKGSNNADVGFVDAKLT